MLPLVLITSDSAEDPDLLSAHRRPQRRRLRGPLYEFYDQIRTLSRRGRRRPNSGALT